MKVYNNNKIAHAYPYKYNNKHKNLWIILNDNMKKNLTNYKINDNIDKLAISNIWQMLHTLVYQNANTNIIYL